MKICFLDNTEFKYDSSNLDDYKLRGAEKVLINLSRELKNLGINVTIINNCNNEKIIQGIKWLNINEYNSNENFDVAISNGDIRFLDRVNAKKKFAISYSNQSLEKFVRKKQLKSFILNKPKILFIGKYHKEKRNILLRCFGYEYLDLAVDDEFLNQNIDLKKKINNNQAIFTSRGDRNGHMLYTIWKNNIFNKNKNVKLLCSPIDYLENPENFNVIIRKMVDKNELINDLKNSRMMLVPGHKAELYCLAAEEARELCVPIVTLGIGSLRERVQHGKTGFIAKNIDEFTHYTLELFNNNNLWNEIRQNLFIMRGKYNWKLSAQKFKQVLIK
jgi:glycosyltransferase involved in cell wall biosynthesis